MLPGGVPAEKTNTSFRHALRVGEYTKLPPLES